MAKRTNSLRGYIGEVIVEQWLHYQFREADGFEIKRQILPIGGGKIGGSYLTFGVLRDGIVEVVYEVNTQDYKLTSLNKFLVYIWENVEHIDAFEVQGELGEEYPANRNLEAFLILLAKPDFRKLEILSVYQVYVRYFKEIFNDPNFQIDVGAVKDDFLENYEGEIKFLKGVTK